MARGNRKARQQAQAPERIELTGDAIVVHQVLANVVAIHKDAERAMRAILAELETKTENILRQMGDAVQKAREAKPNGVTAKASVATKAPK